MAWKLNRMAFGDHFQGHAGHAGSLQRASSWCGPTWDCHPWDRFHGQVSGPHLGIRLRQGPGLFQIDGIDTHPQDGVLYQRRTIPDQHSQDLQFRQVLKVLQLEALIAGLVVALNGAVQQKYQG